MTDTRELIDVWERTGLDHAACLDELAPADWDRPTGLPGWRVRDVAAHVVALERTMATDELPTGELRDSPAHVTNDFQRFTELGVRGLAGEDPATFADLLRGHLAASTARVRALDLTDLTQPAAIGFAPLMGWNWSTVLSNRPIDFWFHEHDIRHAAGRPGGVEGPGPAACVAQVQRWLAVIVGKRVQPAPGTVVRFVVTGPVGCTSTLVIDNNGRAAVSAAATDPDVTLTMGIPSLVRLLGGRGPAIEVPVDIEGDAQLARRVLVRMATTP